MPDITMTEFEETRRNPNSIEVEIDSSKVSGTQQSIPMMLEVPNSSNSSLNVVVFGDNGEQLPVEIEGVANDKNWIHLSNTIQPVMNQRMKVFYGGAGGKPLSDSTYGSEAVWGGYDFVLHMSQNPTGTILDSTSNGRNATPSGFVSGDLVNGPYGKGIIFDGSADMDIGATNDFENGTYTIEMYGSISTTAANHRTIFYKGDASTKDIAKFNLVHSSGQLLIEYYNGGISYIGRSTPTYDDDVTRYYVGRRKHTATAHMNVFADGVEPSYSVQTSGTDTTTVSSVGKIGSRNGVASNWFAGIMHELRYSPNERSDNYILTTSKNLNNPTESGTDPFYKSITKELNYTQSLKSFGRAG